MSQPTVVVVGAGIAGLAAAWELLQHNDIHVIVLEAADRPGGKLRTADVAGQPIDVGAESMLARRPEALDLFAEAGLSTDVVHPRPVPAAIWSRGALCPLPPRTLMGVPSDPATTIGVLTVEEAARAGAERLGPPLPGDVSVGDFVAQRLGDAVVDRLVEPLLAGVYAGHARELSLQASVPGLWPAARTGTSVTAAAAALPTTAATGPVFAGFPGGLGSAIAHLAALLVERGVELRTGTTVRELARTPTGWRLVTGPTTTPHTVEADGVVLAAPAAPTARLLRPHTPSAAALLADVEYASVAIVTLAVPRSAAALIGGSGFLVPPVEGLTIKAATFSASKWEWVDALSSETVLLRASVGRARETAVLQRDDADLVDVALADLRADLGPALPDPVDTHVQRWGGGLPQYAVGHLDRVATVLEAVATLPALGLAGAAYQGVGIPACVASGRTAARAVAGQFRARAGTLRQ
ncbi:MAG: protoporphyrinogen oxidase [Lapillicoccus sp.]